MRAFAAAAARPSPPRAPPARRRPPRWAEAATRRAAPGPSAPAPPPSGRTAPCPSRVRRRRRRHGAGGGRVGGGGGGLAAAAASSTISCGTPAAASAARVVCGDQTSRPRAPRRSPAPRARAWAPATNRRRTRRRRLRRRRRGAARRERGEWRSGVRRLEVGGDRLSAIASTAAAAPPASPPREVEQVGSTKAAALERDRRHLAERAAGAPSAPVSSTAARTFCSIVRLTSTSALKRAPSMCAGIVGVVGGGSAAPAAAPRRPASADGGAPRRRRRRVAGDGCATSARLRIDAHELARRGPSSPSSASAWWSGGCVCAPERERRGAGDGGRRGSAQRV